MIKEIISIADGKMKKSIDVLIVESDATTTNADKACVASGMEDMCDRVGVRFVNLTHEKERIELKVPNPMALDTIKVPKIVTESAIINAAKLKTHMETGVTLGMKNMFGLLPDKFKGKYHVKGINKVATDINSVLKPALTVIDGFVGMEGNGPIEGTPVKANVIVASKDVVAADSVACHIMGISPYTVPHIRRAHDKGLGNIENIQILGDSLESAVHPFKKA